MSEQKLSSPKSRYGYVIAATSFLIQIVGFGLLSNFGLFFNPMLVDFGWSRAALSAATMVNAFSSGVGSVSAGILNDRFGPRLVMSVHGVLFGLGYILMSRISSPWQLYLAYGVLGGIGISAFNIVLLSTAARWFAVRRAMMTGIIKTGAGVGIFIMPFIITALIQSNEWRNSAMILGIGTIVIVTVAAQFLRPSPIHRETSFDSEKQHSNNVSVVKGTGLPFREAAHTKQFWLLCLMLAAFFYSFQAVQVHIVPYAVDYDIPRESAAIIMSIIGAVSIVGRLALGYIGDRRGTKFGFMICALTLITALIWLQMARNLPALCLFAGIYGIFHGGFTTLMAPMVASLFGTHSIGSILGVSQLCAAVVGGLGSLLTGYLYDIFGNYTVSFLVCLSLSIIGLVILLFIRQVGKDQPARF